ncbi:MAG: hypothetical protein ACI9EF_001185 [Pseudohongiellaceae bacterium]|jgi:hypothetical protein
MSQGRVPGDEADAAANALALDNLDRRLAWLRADLAQYERVSGQLESSRRLLAEIHGKITKLKCRVAAERQDVDDIEGLTFTGLMARLLDNLDACRDKETLEWLAAKARLEQVESEHAAVTANVQLLGRRLDSLADPRAPYIELLGAKTRLLAEHPAEAVDQLSALMHTAERHGVLTDFLRELDEALWAGQVAKAALAGLHDCLAKAQALGKLDMLGLASNWVKFEHLNGAQRHASSANRALSRFAMELTDVQARHHAELTLEVSQLATFADYFLDDMISDWVVQCRIDKSHRSAGIARTRVSRTLRALGHRRHEIVVELRLIEERQVRLRG